MIRYAIDQEDGQTARTDYTDANIFKKKRLKTMYWAEEISICKGNSTINKADSHKSRAPAISDGPTDRPTDRPTERLIESRARD